MCFVLAVVAGPGVPHNFPAALASAWHLLYKHHPTWYHPRGSKALRECSSSRTLPPGLTTLAISRRACTGSG